MFSKIVVVVVVVVAVVVVVVVGGVCSILVASTRIMVKEENEKNHEFIKSNYWKLKNELSRRTNGGQKRKRSSK